MLKYTFLAVGFVLILSACTSFHAPVLPGPADTVDCTIKRAGSQIGNYKCTVEGRYEVKEIF